MIRFDFLESRGATVAAISGKNEGDCGAHAPSARARKAFLRTLGLNSARLVCPRQVHGCAVACVSASDRTEGVFGLDKALAEADAVITNVPGLPLGITVADCVPVFVVAEGGRAAGLVHGGREGTKTGVTQNAVRALCSRYALPPADLYAVIGPSAGPCCYEVSAEMAADFHAAGYPVRGRNLDLWEANRIQLLRAGIPEQHILVSAICTICGPHFFSYRTNKSRERNLAVLAI